MWFETLGTPGGFTPVLVTGTDSNGQCVFIFPLARRKVFGMHIITWVGVPELTYGWGVFDRTFLRQQPDALKALWPQIIDKIKPADALWLSDQPEKLADTANPLGFAFTQQNANRGHVMALDKDYNQLFARKRSSSSRRSIRKRDKKLLNAGDIFFGLPDSRKTALAVIDTMLEHQGTRLAAKGVTDFYSKRRRNFLHGLVETSDDTKASILMPYHLTINGAIVAVMLGGRFQNTYWAMIASLDPNTTYHAFSPGDFALRATIEDLCKKGFSTLDFASGDTDYKLHWRDEAVQLHDTLVPLSAKGTVWSAYRSARIYLKNFIKKNTTLFALAIKLRKLLFAR